MESVRIARVITNSPGVRPGNVISDFPRTSLKVSREKYEQPPSSRFFLPPRENKVFSIKTHAEALRVSQILKMILSALIESIGKIYARKFDKVYRVPRDERPPFLESRDPSYPGKR